MVSKAWKNFINETLTELEDVNFSSSENFLDSSSHTDSFDADPSKIDKKTWCNTIDRSLGYAFKSFCRFVVSRTLNEASIYKNYQILPENFQDFIDRTFKYTPVELPEPLPNYYDSYPRYARWHNWVVRNNRFHCFNRNFNFSFFRRIVSPKAKNRRAKPKQTPLELGRYKVVKPVHQFKTPNLNSVFN